MSKKLMVTNILQAEEMAENSRKSSKSNLIDQQITIRWTIRTSFTPVTMVTTSESLGCPLTRGFFIIVIIIIVIIIVIVIVIIIVVVIVTIIVVIII